MTKNALDRYRRNPKPWSQRLSNTLATLITHIREENSPKMGTPVSWTDAEMQHQYFSKSDLH